MFKPLLLSSSSGALCTPPTSRGESDSESPFDEGDDNDFILLPEELGLPPMPKRFVQAELGDHAKGVARFKRTLAWREEQKTDSVLRLPHPRFDFIKRCYSTSFHLPDKQGRLVYFERPGTIQWAKLTAVGISVDELIRHYMYCMEFLWQELLPRQTDTVSIVVDLEGMRLMDVRGDVSAFMKATINMMSRHYPQRSSQIFVINAPSTFNAVYTVIKPLLCERTRNKIRVVPAAAVSRTLLEAIDAANLPMVYGGSCAVPLGESVYERRLRDYATAAMSSATMAASSAASASTVLTAAYVEQVPLPGLAAHAEVLPPPPPESPAVMAMEKTSALPMATVVG